MKNATITIRISEQEKEALKEIAERYDAPMSQMIRELIKTFIMENSTEQFKEAHNGKDNIQ